MPSSTHFLKRQALQFERSPTRSRRHRLLTFIDDTSVVLETCVALLTEDRAAKEGSTAVAGGHLVVIARGRTVADPAELRVLVSDGGLLLRHQADLSCEEGWR